MQIITQYSDQEEKEAQLKSSIEHLQQTEDILTLIMLAGAIWASLYIWAIWRCVTCLRLQHQDIWTTLNKPTTFKGNVRLLGFTFSRRVKHLPKTDRWQFYALRWLAMLGVIYVLVVITAFSILF